MNIYIIFQLIGLTLNIGILIYIFGRLLETKVGKAFFLIVLSITIWILGEVLMDSSTNSVIALEWTKFSNIGVAFIGPSLIWFVLVLTNHEQILKIWVKISIILISFIFSFVSLKTDLIFSGITKTYWGYETINGATYFIFSLYVSVCAIIAITLTFFNISRLSWLQKKQMQLFSFAFIIPIVGGIFSEIIAPIIGLNIPPMTSILFSYTAIIIAYAIKKYQFLSITSTLALQTVFDTLNDIIMAVDDSGKIILINHPVTPILDYGVSNLIGKPLTEVFGPEMSYQSIKQLIEKYPEGFATVVNNQDNTKKISVLVSGNIIISPTGVEQGLVLVAHDQSYTDNLISHLKEKTTELEASSAKLENTVKEVQKLNSFMVDRELKMLELKNQIKEIETKCKP